MAGVGIVADAADGGPAFGEAFLIAAAGVNSADFWKCAWAGCTSDAGLLECPSAAAGVEYGGLGEELAALLSGAAGFTGDDMTIDADALDRMSSVRAS